MHAYQITRRNLEDLSFGLGDTFFYVMQAHIYSPDLLTGVEELRIS